jgi:DNA invertase Pin-like site-specific DNA recombinase
LGYLGQLGKGAKQAYYPRATFFDFLNSASMQSFVSYYRVSTAKQGVSGLGLEAQKATVQAFVASRGTIAQEFIEIESGKKDVRPQLDAALGAAKQAGATLLIAKLDRLSRNVGFIFALRDSGVDFVACDLPEANTLTIGIFAVMAQHERETIAKRTKDALAAKKARGFQLGTPSNLTAEAAAKGRAAQRDRALGDPDRKKARGMALLLREKGQTTREIAAALNDTGYTTRQGGVFHPTTVLRLLAA